MGDEIVAAGTARVAAAQLEVLNCQLPQGEIVGQQVDLGQQGGPGLVHLRAQVQTSTVTLDLTSPLQSFSLTSEVNDLFLPEESKEELGDGA